MKEIEVHGSLGLPFGGSTIGFVLNLDHEEEFRILRALYEMDEAGEPKDGRGMILHIPLIRLFGCKVRIVTDG